MNCRRDPEETGRIQRRQAAEEEEEEEEFMTFKAHHGGCQGYCHRFNETQKQKRRWS